MRRHTLPVILSIPHGGFGVPDELAGRLAVTDTDIYNECDLWIEELFDFSACGPSTGRASEVLAKVTTPIARALVDVNRPSAELDNPDGPVKSQTSYGRTTCASPLELDVKQQLVQKYWQPYHAALERALAEHGREAKLFLDCHNMAQTGPTTYGDPGAKRPLICLANLGAADGSAQSPKRPISCDPAFIRRAADIAEGVFAGIALLEPQPGPQPPLVAINRPYPGGYILIEYARQREERELPPGLMVEFNRGLFVGDQNAQTSVAPPNLKTIETLRQRIHEWLVRVLEIE